MQAEVIHSPNPQDAHSREAAASPVQQSAADGTEVSLHSGTRGDRLVLRPSAELVLSTEMLKGLVLDGEVRSKHRRRNLVTVGAIADEAVDEVFAFHRLCEW